jgi:uncharacterized membrane protein
VNSGRSVSRSRGEIGRARGERRRLGITYWSLVGLGLFSVVLVLVNAVLGYERSGLEERVAAKQLYINQTLTVSQLNVKLIQALANVAASTGDQNLKQLLASQGIDYTVQPAGGIGDGNE